MKAIVEEVAHRSQNTRVEYTRSVMVGDFMFVSEIAGRKKKPRRLTSFECVRSCSTTDGTKNVLAFMVLELHLESSSFEEQKSFVLLDKEA